MKLTSVNIRVFCVFMNAFYSIFIRVSKRVYTFSWDYHTLQSNTAFYAAVSRHQKSWFMSPTSPLAASNSMSCIIANRSLLCGLFTGASQPQQRILARNVVICSSGNTSKFALSEPMPSQLFTTPRDWIGEDQTILPLFVTMGVGPFTRKVASSR